MGVAATQMLTHMSVDQKASDYIYGEIMFSLRIILFLSC
jgi:hypothetical protein